MTGPVADYLTRLRSAIKAGYRMVEIPASSIKKDITKISFDKGYILNYMFEEEGCKGTIEIALKHDLSNKVNAIKCLKRASRLDLRKYVGYKDMSHVLNGLGIAILSTSHGVMADREVHELKIGGEVLYYVY